MFELIRYRNSIKIARYRLQLILVNLKMPCLDFLVNVDVFG